MATGRNGRASKSGVFGAAFVLGAVVLLCLVTRAGADLSFCPPGAAAGQCASPAGLNSLRGLAVDYENGRLYVADRNNNRVNVFEQDGTFVFAFGWGVDTGAPELQTCTAASGCQVGIAGSGPGQFDHATGVTVDNASGSPSRHAIYVVDESNSRVQKFSPTGGFIWMVGTEGEGEGQFKSSISASVGPGGVVYVLDNLPLGGGEFEHRLQRFKDTGELIPSQCTLFEGGRARSIAVDTGGNSWVASEGAGRGIRKYDPACTQLAAIDTDIENIAVAVDEADLLFAAQNEGRDKAVGSFQVITAHNSGGGILSRFGYGRLSSKPEGLAVHAGGEGGIFVSQGDEGVKRLDFPPPTPTLPPPGPIAAPPSVEAPLAKIGSTKATVVAEVNPEGKATQVHFEYLTQADYEAQGNSFSGPATKKTSDASLGVEGFKLKTIEAQIGCPDPANEVGKPGNKCLTPETTYRFRVIATNVDGGGEGPAEGPPFKTRKSPELGDTYTTAVGTDTARLHAELNPLGVSATGYFEYVDDAAYQQDIDEGGDGFRIATKAPDVDAESPQAPLDFGAAEGFVTRSISVYPLAPGTAYHYRIVADSLLTEPVQGDPHVLRTFKPPSIEPCSGNEASRIGPGALLPDCRAYEMVSPLDKAGGDIRVLRTSLDLPAVLEQSSDSGERLAYGSFRSFGDALSAPVTSQYIAQRIEGKEWQTHGINPPRGRPLFGAAGQTDTEFKFFSSDLCEGWLTTYADSPVPLSENELAGFSNLFRRSDRLCGVEGYEALAPITAPLNVPEGAAFLMELQGVSADGTHAIFTANGQLPSGGSNKGSRQLFEVFGSELRPVCVLPNGGALSGACAAGSSPVTAIPGPQPWAISRDGERIFWSTPNGGEGKLYVRISGTETVPVSEEAEAVEGTSASRFWYATPDGSKTIFSTGNLNGQAKLYSFEPDGEVTSLIAEGVIGVMGMSEDSGRIYFASGKVLAPGATEGKPNLYLRETGEGGESTEFIATLASADLTDALSSEAYYKRTSRVTPDGANVAFVSIASLTGYDNKGAASGEASREIFRYDANTNELICASCNPSGARPAGPSRIPEFETSMHAARVLSDDGRRLYFESADSLVARDSNGRVDVYQWEELGAGGCDVGDANFVASAEGCIELISSGQSPLDSRFVEASRLGKDVFIGTVASLLPQDYGLFDIYDARVGGGLPIPAPMAPPCEGDACNHPPAAPDEPTPSSSDYVAPPSGRSSKGKGRCPKNKRLVTKKGKSRCVPKKHKKQRQRGGAAR